jgi:hypothetical protein
MIDQSKNSSLINPLKQSDPEQSQVTLGTPMEVVKNKVSQLLVQANTTGGRSGLTKTVRSLTYSTTSASMFTPEMILKAFMLFNMLSIKDSIRNGQSFMLKMQ